MRHCGYGECARGKLPAVLAIEDAISCCHAHVQVVAHIVEELEKAGKQQQLQGYEMIKAVHVTLEDWTEANDLMTPSMKVSWVPPCYSLSFSHDKKGHRCPGNFQACNRGAS